MITRRGKAGFFSHVRRVPARFKAVEPRKHVFTSLKTQDHAEAMRKALAVELIQEQAWSALMAGYDRDALKFFNELRAIANDRLDIAPPQIWPMAVCVKYLPGQK